MSEKAVNPIQLLKRDTVDVVAEKVKEFQSSGELHFPAGYSPDNAMKSAWLILQTVEDKSGNKALEVCTKDSIANAVLDMVVQGLNPAKKQGYFLVYGRNLVFQRSYFGTMAVTKRVTGAKSIEPMVIYHGDHVNYEIVNGKITNLTHKQEFGNIDKDKIIGAYCTIEMPNGEVYTEVMTIAEIKKSWTKSKMNPDKKGGTHDEFTQEMAKRTVINRACKRFLNSSDDGSLVMKHINQDEDNEELELQAELEEKANGEIIDIEAEEPEPVNVEPEKPSAYDIIDADFEVVGEEEAPPFG